MKLSDGEKLILMVLADMYKHLEIKGEFDPDFISATISGGHLWGLRWKYTHIPFETSENPPEVSETVDILDMWSFLEESYGKLSPADNQKVEKEANRTSVRLFGFDANNEDHYFIARYLIEQLGRYPSFRGRDLNSPSPRIDGYRRMYRVFEPIRPTLVDRPTKLLRFSMRSSKHQTGLATLPGKYAMPTGELLLARESHGEPGA
jgi:uncharacterized protein